MLKHIVFMKFKPTTQEADIVDLEKSLGALPDVIPEIKGYEFGRDIVKTDRSYDFALVSAFEDLDALKGYQLHPEHMLVLEKVKKLVEDIRAVDYLV
ncbi:Dabb family protein [Desulfoferrobacter suflitae]|uniref:Dabb family protein n=1 Tax=Desulfoferrobacter suflitae TaxID=2865782 RepID=UPI0021645D6C|nr:Dabb family protein [Desulfoferrobacter suflitae]MCK8601266.1 Dabb family protein [Desulfoferrobacter suflitae]